MGGMKTLISNFMVILLVAGAGLFAGCATGSHESTAGTQPTPMPGIYQEASKISPPADMNWLGKTGYYIGWISLECLYGFAAGNPSFSR